MKTSRPLTFGWLLAALLLFVSLFAVVGHADTLPNSDLVLRTTATDPAVTTAPNAGTLADNIVTWLTPLLVPLIIAAKKKVAPSIPSWCLPIIAPLLGVALDLINTYALGHQSNLLLAALLGLAGVGVREVKDQLVPAKSTLP